MEDARGVPVCSLLHAEATGALQWASTGQPAPASLCHRSDGDSQAKEGGSEEELFR